MKSYSDITIVYIVWGIVLLFILGANYLHIPPDSIVIKVFDSLEPSPKFMCFVLGVIIFYILIVFIRRSQK
jgi:uncharacterized membrane protein YwaF